MLTPCAAQRDIARQLETALSDLPGMSAVLPGSPEVGHHPRAALRGLHAARQLGACPPPPQAKSRVLRIVEQLEASSAEARPLSGAARSLLEGDWRLVYASNGGHGG